MSSHGRIRTYRRLIILEIVVAMVALCIGITITKVVADRGYVFGSGIWSAVFIFITCGIEVCIGSGIVILGGNVFVSFIALIEVILSSVFTALMYGCFDCKSASTGGSLYLVLTLTMIIELILTIITCAAGCGCCCDESSESSSPFVEEPSIRLPTRYQRPVRNQALFDSVMNNRLNNDHSQEGNNHLQPSAQHLDVNPSAPLDASDPMLEDHVISVDDNLPVYDDLEPPPAYDQLFPTQIS